MISKGFFLYFYTFVENNNHRNKNTVTNIATAEPIIIKQMASEIAYLSQFFFQSLQLAEMPLKLPNLS